MQAVTVNRMFVCCLRVSPDVQLSGDNNSSQADELGVSFPEGRKLSQSLGP